MNHVDTGDKRVTTEGTASTKTLRQKWVQHVQASVEGTIQLKEGRQEKYQLETWLETSWVQTLEDIVGHCKDLGLSFYSGGEGISLEEIPISLESQAEE